jgi:hypothetical protein
MVTGLLSGPSACCLNSPTKSLSVRAASPMWMPMPSPLWHTTTTTIHQHQPGASSLRAAGAKPSQSVTINTCGRRLARCCHMRTNVQLASRYL